MLLPNLILNHGEVELIKVISGNSLEENENDVWEGRYLVHEACTVKELRAIPFGTKALEVGYSLGLP